MNRADLMDTIRAQVPQPEAAICAPDVMDKIREWSNKVRPPGSPPFEGTINQYCGMQIFEHKAAEHGMIYFGTKQQIIEVISKLNKPPLDAIPVIVLEHTNRDCAGLRISTAGSLIMERRYPRRCQTRSSKVRGKRNYKRYLKWKELSRSITSQPDSKENSA